MGTFLSCFTFSGITRSQGIILEALVKYYGATTSQATMLTTVSMLCLTIFSLFGTMLGELYTARVVVMAAGVIACTGMSLASLGFSVPYIAVTFGVGLGTGNGLMYGNCLAMVGAYFQKKRALANSMALSGASLGQMAIPPFIGVIVEEYSVKGALLILGGVYLQIVIVGALFRPISVIITPETSLDVLLSIRSLDKGEYDPERRELSISPDDASSVLSDESQQRFVDILKNKVHREEGMINKIASFGGSTTSKIFFPYASGHNIMSASLANLQRINHKVEIAMSQIISIESIDEERECTRYCGCCCRWNIPKVIDFSVLKNFKVLFFCVFYFGLQFTALDFALFLPSIVADRGIDDYRAGLLLSIGGVADLIGRLTCGIVANYGLCARYKIVAGCAVTMGINVLVFLTANAYWQMAIQYAISNATLGANVALLPLVVIESLGLELLPKVLGLILFSAGLGPSFGQAVLGLLKDQTGGFDAVLILLGITGILSGVLLVFYPFVRRLEDRRERKRREDEVKRKQKLQR
ncbi:monocarboxylate transporter 12-like [Liolophura sinensis]|uniref:monocarboxylate transporter 12-like n=1 Tax=Liolophura sinensis TaxID=3198878 RepID=UPI0031587CB6